MVLQFTGRWLNHNKPEEGEDREDVKVSREVGEEFAPLALAVAPNRKIRNVPARQFLFIPHLLPARNTSPCRVPSCTKGNSAPQALPESIPAPPVGEVLAEHDLLIKGIE